MMDLNVILVVLYLAVGCCSHLTVQVVYTVTGSRVL